MFPNVQLTDEITLQSKVLNNVFSEESEYSLNFE